MVEAVAAQLTSTPLSELFGGRPAAMLKLGQKTNTPSVMLGLDPGIHCLDRVPAVDCLVKPDNDEEEGPDNDEKAAILLGPELAFVLSLSKDDPGLQPTSSVVLGLDPGIHCLDMIPNADSARLLSGVEARGYSDAKTSNHSKARRTMTLLSDLAIIGLMAACGPGPSADRPPTTHPQVIPTPIKSPGPVVSSQPQPTPTPTVPGGGQSPQPSVTGQPGLSIPRDLNTIRFGNVDRYLEFVGEKLQLPVLLLNAAGEIIPGQVPLEWTSSRPTNFVVEADGTVRALVNEGFSEITARIPGTAFEARTVISVSAGNVGGGGGGGGSSPVVSNNTAPVITSLTASQTAVIGQGVLVRLNATATDAQSTLNASSYRWSCSPQATCGAPESVTGMSVYWRSPAQSAPYQLQVTVSDGQLSSSQSITIDVQTGSGEVTVNPN